MAPGKDGKNMWKALESSCPSPWFTRALTLLGREGWVHREGELLSVGRRGVMEQGRCRGWMLSLLKSEWATQSSHTGGSRPVIFRDPRHRLQRQKPVYANFFSNAFFLVITFSLSPSHCTFLPLSFLLPILLHFLPLSFASSPLPLYTFPPLIPPSPL